jgi:hypothetical protein
MKNDAQKSLTGFDNLPGVDPAVESLLGQGQRRQKKERARAFRKADAEPD